VAAAARHGGVSGTPNVRVNGKAFTGDLVVTVWWPPVDRPAVPRATSDSTFTSGYFSCQATVRL
jgi:hypothetical protein